MHSRQTYKLWRTVPYKISQKCLECVCFPNRSLKIKACVITILISVRRICSGEETRQEPLTKSIFNIGIYLPQFFIRANISRPSRKRHKQLLRIIQLLVQTYSYTFLKTWVKTRLFHVCMHSVN